MVSLLIPLMIAGGFDGVEPLRPSAPPREIKFVAGGQMTSNDAVKKRWGRKVCGEAAAACARTGKMPRLVVERGSCPIVIRPATELRGLGAAARKCGVSHTHLRKVLQGERVPSADLQRKMYRLGLYPGMMKAEVA